MHKYLPSGLFKTCFVFLERLRFLKWFYLFITYFWLCGVFLAVCGLCSSFKERRRLSSCGTEASHHSGFSGCRAWVPGLMGLRSYRLGAQLHSSFWHLTWAGVRAVTPALAGRFLTSRPPQKSNTVRFCFLFCSAWWKHAQSLLPLNTILPT